MSSSDDEEEVVPRYVTNYHFVDDKDVPISFSVLPMRWGKGGSLDGTKTLIFLHGFTDSGLQKIYKQVTEWKLDLSDKHPDISVLSKKNCWIKLQKPRKSFEDTIRTILITIYCVHFAKKNTQASDSAHWEYLRKVFSSYEVRPSGNDLSYHLPLIRAMVKTDEAVSKSKFLLAFLENPKKRTFNEEYVYTGPDAKKSKFIVDDEDEDEELDDDDGESDLFDYVCAICDNGGEILCCEGKCMRSFHATRDAGVESDCKSLGMSRAQVQVVKNFFCQNCQYKQHQCFACGKLGSSDKSSGAEVFCCVSATCGHFYHPECIAQLLHPGNEAEAEEHRSKIVAGESFTCPVHKCLVCKEAENTHVKELQFAICRRCPRAYHRMCLPRKISFTDSPDGTQRAWPNLIPNRILIYCMRHKIDDDLKTPIRNHIIFPNIIEKKSLHPSGLHIKRKVLIKRKGTTSENAMKSLKMIAKGSAALMASDSSNRRLKPLPSVGVDLLKKYKSLDACKEPSKDCVKPTVERSSSVNVVRVQVREEISRSSMQSKGMEPSMSKPKVTASTKLEKISSPVLKKKLSNSAPVVGVETEKKILDLMEKISSEVTLEDIMAKDKLPSTHAYTSRHVDKTITQGKVEGVVEAVRTALKKLEEGYSIEDAKVVCEPRVLYQIITWKKKLNVYLSPFLHGMRYTSFGRHFTKVEKLKEIVDKLHWYVQNGDMIVDFCCGANDFSCLMRDKLEKSGKNCSFKNYDLIQAKDDFCFEKKDWMTVGIKELPPGSQLIMGLNPPFGVKASLANNFIKKALEFRPKLLILIVPEATERLDKKKDPYDLIWMDGGILSGKSFYLPGSVDVNDKQVDQWNVKPPPLYLWSRPDWTKRHRAIAIQQGHILRGWTSRHETSAVQQGHILKDWIARHEDINFEQEHMYKAQELTIEENCIEGHALCHMEEAHGSNMDISKFLTDSPEHNDQGEALEETVTTIRKEHIEEQKEGFPKHDNRVEHSRWEDKGDRGAGCENHGHWKNRVHVDQKVRGDKRKQTRPMTERLTLTGTLLNQTYSASLLQRGPSNVFGTPFERSGSEKGLQHFQFGFSGSSSAHGAGFGLRSSSIREDVSSDLMRYSSGGEGPFTSRAQKHPASRSSDLGHSYSSEGLEEPIHERNVENFSRDAYVDGRELIEKFGHPDSDRLRKQIKFCGQLDPDDLSQIGRQSLSQYSGLSNQVSLSSTFGVVRPVVELSRPIPSVSQRYAPRVEETNLPRADHFMPKVPLMGRTNDYDPPISQDGLRADTLGFAKGLWRHVPHQNSSGWFND